MPKAPKANPFAKTPAKPTKPMGTKPPKKKC